VNANALRAVMLGWVRRVARSPHRDRLVLRGSLLTSVWCPTRAAADVDHLVVGGFTHEEARALVDELLATADESTSFDLSSTEHSIIWAETPSPGLRTKVMGRAGTAGEALLQIDLGQGDELVLAPSLVSVDENPPLLAVQPETMFAWKFDGIFEFGHGSWRAKDLYDVWLLGQLPLPDERVVTSLRAAFHHQGMDLSVADRFLFTEEWGRSRGSRRRWESFGRKAGLGASLPDLVETVGHIRRRLLPIFAALGHVGPGGGKLST